MTPSFFLYTFGTFFSYMLAFYFVLPLRITGRQICWHVLATAVWANVVFLMVFSLDHGFMFILAGIIEVIYLIITLHLFAEGNFYENFIVFWGTFQISDGLARIIMESLVDADFVYAYRRVDTLVRRYFTETGHLLQKKNGSMLYQPDRDKITISVMYITGRYQKEQQMEGHYENRNMR